MKKILHFLVLVLCCVFVFVNVAEAWVPVGLQGSNVTSLGKDPEGQVMYIGTDSGEKGLWAYKDGEVSRFLDVPVKVNAIDVNSFGDIYIGTHGNSLYVFTETGWKNFIISDGALQADLIYSVAVDPKFDDGHRVLFGSGYDIWESLDSGATAHVVYHESNAYIGFRAITFGHEGEEYAINYSGGILRRRQTESNWHYIKTGGCQDIIVSEAQGYYTLSGIGNAVYYTATSADVSFKLLYQLPKASDLVDKLFMDGKELFIASYANREGIRKVGFGNSAFLMYPESIGHTVNCFLKFQGCIYVGTEDGLYRLATASSSNDSQGVPQQSGCFICSIWHF